MVSAESKIAIVTGATGGLGVAICRRLAKSGCSVVVNCLKKLKEAEELCLEFRRDDLPPGMAVQADVSDFQQATNLVQRTVDTFGKFDILINNAGIRYDQFLLLSKPDQWWNVIHTNLGGAMNCSRAALPHMMGRRQGAIINVSSISGNRGVAGQTAYSASKAALVGFSRALAREVAGHGISVNCVPPVCSRPICARI